MEFSRTRNKLLLSLVLLAQVSQLMQAGVMDWIKADPIRFGAISTSVVLAGLLVKSYLHTPHTNIPARDQAQEKLDQDLKEKFSSDIVKQIHKAKLKEAEMNSFRLRSKLIPAIVDSRSQWTSQVINYFTTEHQQAQLRYQSSEATMLRDRIAKEHNNKSIALFGFILSQRHNQVNGGPATQHLAIKHFFEAQLQQPEQLLFKNDPTISPRKLLDTALLPGEIAFVGYSDGDVQILLNDDDRQSLANLSDEQRDFIASLYKDRFDWYQGLYLNKKESMIFSTLSHSHQRYLQRFYNIRSNFDFYVSRVEDSELIRATLLAGFTLGFVWIVMKYEYNEPLLSITHTYS